MTPMERIKTLQLTGGEITVALPFNPAYKHYDSARLIADAQYDKLLEGLAKVIPEWFSEYQTNWGNDDMYIPTMAYIEFSELFREALGKGK